MGQNGPPSILGRRGVIYKPVTIAGPNNIRTRNNNLAQYFGPSAPYPPKHKYYSSKSPDIYQVIIQRQSSYYYYHYYFFLSHFGLYLRPFSHSSMDDASNWPNRVISDTLEPFETPISPPTYLPTGPYRPIAPHPPTGPTSPTSPTPTLESTGPSRNRTENRRAKRVLPEDLATILSIYMAHRDKITSINISI